MLKNIDCGYSLEPPHRGGSNEYHNLCLKQKYEKYQNFLSENVHFLVVKFSVYLNRHVFVKKGSWLVWVFMVRLTEILKRSCTLTQGQKILKY